MSKLIYLYLKTHNTTGLKYLGKTVKDPFEYKGSGVYWNNHIKKHGYNVTTEILFQSENMEEFRKVAHKYSKDLNIVESTEFANLMDENGQGGVNSGSFKKGIIPWSKGKKMPTVGDAKRAYWDTWKAAHPNYKDKWKTYQKVGYAKNSAQGKKMAAQNNATILSCPHCDKTGNVPNMKRWHFDNCKSKL